jgi:hypothetical protein
VIEFFPTLHSRRSILAALFLLLAAVFFLPYLVPVTPSVSLSYVVGYNNRAAFVIFSAGCVLFALLSRRRFPEAVSTDQPLGRPSLIVALVIALLSCAYRLLPLGRHTVGGEAFYAINRIQMLVQGLRPYRQFEFVYGPAHVYMPVLLARLTHGSVFHGYYGWWILQWLLGTTMLWATMRLLPFPLPHRRIIFWIVFVIQLPAIIAEGTAYTPTRTVGSAFFVVLVAWLFDRGTKPLLIAGTAILCVGAALSISPEQGIALFSGLLVWFIFLTRPRAGLFPLRATITFFLGAAAALLGAWYLGEFSSLTVFAKGAFSFPLLPSPTNIVILAAYVAAACVGVHAFLDRRFESVAIPMFLTGFALLPAAMGRCDYGHLIMAAPAFLLGVAAMDARPSLRIWWAPFAIVLIALPAVTVPYYLQHWPLQAHVAGSAKRAAAYAADPAAFAQHPCPVVYRTLTVAPKSFETPAQDCFDTGRYTMTADAFTPQTVDIMLRDLDRRPLAPIVFHDLPLAEELKPLNNNLTDLRVYELSPWLPQPRNPPFSYQKLQAYVEQHYTPSPIPVNGFRIWYPRSDESQ